MYNVVLAAGHDKIANQIKDFEEINIVEENNDIEILEEVLEFIEADFAIINTLLSTKKSLKFAEKAKEYNVKVISIIDKEKIDKKLVLGLASWGATALISYDELYLIPDMLTAYPETIDYSLVKEHSDSSAGNAVFFQKRKTTIAVLGIMPRIGTTTQALALAKYLTTRGYPTAYIELNESNYIKKLAESYQDAIVDNDCHKISYSNVDMYYDPEQVSTVLKMPYLFYIYDFGDIHNLHTREQQIAWLEKDLKILVTGAKPNEIEKMGDILNQVYPQNTKYLFNFTDDSERGDIKDLMAGRKSVTFFSDWVPDPFTADVHCFTEMMASYIAKTAPVAETPSHKRNKHQPFWRRK